jgi:hypothetical protein
MPMETIIHNAKIATNGVASFVAAIAIERGRIAAVGTDCRGQDRLCGGRVLKHGASGIACQSGLVPGEAIRRICAEQ